MLLVGLCISTGTVKAGTLGPVCGSCAGGVYTLTYSNFQNLGTTDKVDASLKINTDTYTGGGLFIDAVSIKIASAIQSIILIAAPTSAPVGSAWNTFDGALNANGCSGAGSGAGCSESNGQGAAISTDALNAAVNNTFTWQITILAGAMFDGLNEASIKVLFTDANGNKAGPLVSENITLTQSGNDPNSGVPEPMTFVLMGAGLVGIAALRRKTA